MIKIENLSKFFGKKQVLNNLNLEVKKGQTLVLLGASGAGKSILLRHILGLEVPDEGKILIRGKCVTGLKGRALRQALKGTGMLFQNGALFDFMTVEENVAFHPHTHGKNGDKVSFYTPDELDDKVAESLDIVGLNGTQKLMTGQLSGGMRKRVALARLLIYRPDILLYDEPTAGLDPSSGLLVGRLITEIQERLKATSVVVTHDIGSALQIANEIALHEKGCIAAHQTIEEFQDAPHSLFKKFLDQKDNTPK
ncbi:Methionine import ATP-binding protein MetN [Candidatus Clavichlamydia salmonicola]|uniref:ABC transporter ATP-binding protein n=1 Tax=Candidatus Clavichlamydia salmonicola TaxID=469812 RepID=UPI001891A93C|nr:ATP-binding cassette domain-containing protein [Candidatus Clavichlamydia salmonicola]MBF5050787.1 Methionine import ATP-binding protein MetN [Candidatus Clavichlamydia salmonicola]